MARRSRRMRPNRSRATRISSMSAPKRTRLACSFGSFQMRAAGCGRTRKGETRCDARSCWKPRQFPTANSRLPTTPNFQRRTPNNFQLEFGNWELGVVGSWALGIGSSGGGAEPLRNDSLRELIRHRPLLLSHTFGVYRLSLG